MIQRLRLMKLYKELYEEDADEEAKLNSKTKTIPTNFNGKKATCKMQNFSILLTFLLITIALLISVRIYCYQIKYHAKQKEYCHFTSKTANYNKIIY